MSIPLTLVVHAMLPESPKFLAARGRVEELRALMSRLRPERRAAYENAVFRTTEHTVSQNTIAALLAPRYRRVSLTIWLTAFLTLFAIFGLTGWIPTVMIKRGETFAASFGFGALLQAMSFFGGLALATLADRGFAATPRLLGTWWAIGGLAVGALVFVNGHGFNIAVVAIAGFCVIGAQHVLNNYSRFVAGVTEVASVEHDLQVKPISWMLPRPSDPFLEYHKKYTVKSQSCLFRY